MAQKLKISNKRRTHLQNYLNNNVNVTSSKWTRTKHSVLFTLPNIWIDRYIMCGKRDTHTSPIMSHKSFLTCVLLDIYMWEHYACMGLDVCVCWCFCFYVVCAIRFVLMWGYVSSVCVCQFVLTPLIFIIRFSCLGFA